MKRFEGLLMCTDLDGTLLRADKTISRENLDAIEHFKNEGGKFTFISGRMPCTAWDIFDIIKPNAPFGCINGGGIYDGYKREYIWAEKLDPLAMDIVERVYDTLPSVGFQVNTLDNIYFCRENFAMQEFRRLTGVPNLVRHFRDMDETVAKVVFGEHRNKEILELADFLAAQPLAPEFSLIRSDSMLYEILPKGVSKGSALPILAKSLGVDMKNTIAVGDYDNDITMLKAAGVGYAVSNATAAAKEAADKITVSNEEHAIAKIISEL
jgi:Cof subfamily protein (haloacid dehalogenase superfamily)